MNHITTDFFVPVKLSSEAHNDARKCAGEQPTLAKAKQVYYNTLAVYAVRDYLEWMEFETDFNNCDRADYILRKFHNVADLMLTNIGKIECRPIFTDTNLLALPSEVTENRIACILVKLEASLKYANLLGFFPASNNKELPDTIDISQLQDFSTLIEYLDNLEWQSSSNFSVKAIDLSQWFDHIFDAVWQDIVELLGEKRHQLALGNARRSTGSEVVFRGQKITLEMADEILDLGLVVGVTRNPSATRTIPIQIHPLNNKNLPDAIKLIALDMAGNIIAQEQAGCDREWIQINVEGKSGESFMIEIELEEIAINHSFVI